MVVGLVMAVAGCRSAPPPADPGPPRPRHVVVLLHGVYGNESHFGSMGEALVAHLPALDPGYAWEAHAFEYDTLSPTAGAREFAEDLGKFLKDLFPDGAEPADRVSFVMHSQGGLVGTWWVARALEGDPRVHPVLLPHLDGFITLATPFWGAKMATFTRGLEPVRRAQGLPDPTPAARQLVEMSFGSDTIERFRHGGVRLAEEGVPAALQHIRPLSVGGFVKWLKPAAAVSVGEDEYEDDTAVPLPSARPSFLYARALDEGYAGGALVPASAFAEARLAPFVLVNAIHLSPVVELPQISRGVAQVQAGCIESAACDHPSFGLVLAHLARQPLPPSDAPLDAMSGFLVAVSVDLAGPPAGGASGAGAAGRPARVRPDEVQLVVDPEQPDLGVEAGRLLEPFSAGQSPVSSSAAQARLFLTGVARSTWDPAKAEHRDLRLRFEVRAPGYKTRRVEARVRATWTTWVEVLLEPEDPPAR